MVTPLEKAYEKPADRNEGEDDDMDGAEDVSGMQSWTEIKVILSQKLYVKNISYDFTCVRVFSCPKTPYLIV